MNIHLLVALLIVAAILGRCRNYQIAVMPARVCSLPIRGFFGANTSSPPQAFYARHGGKTIVLARFVPIVRTFALFVAGAMGHMAYLQLPGFQYAGRGAVGVRSATLAICLATSQVKSNLQPVDSGHYRGVHPARRD